MFKKIAFISFLVLGILSIRQQARANCLEVSISTCVGDFSQGGDEDTSERLIGNTSNHAFGILQDNKVRIFISTLGLVGIGMDGVSQIPQYQLDVMGVIRSSGVKLISGSSITFADGTQQTTSMNRQTITLQTGQGAAVYPSSNVAQAIDSYSFYPDTFTVTSVHVIVTGDISTMTALMSINKSTEPTTRINVTSINTSSYTVTENLRNNYYGVPDTYPTFYPQDTAYLFCPIAITSGTAPSGVKVKMRGYKW